MAETESKAEIELEELEELGEPGSERGARVINWDGFFDACNELDQQLLARAEKAQQEIIEVDRLRTRLAEIRVNARKHRF